MRTSRTTEDSDCIGVADAPGNQQNGNPGAATIMTSERRPPAGHAVAIQPRDSGDDMDVSSG